MYYATFVKKWQKEYDAHVRALEKGEVEREAEEAAEVNMEQEMEKARREVKEREDRKALTGIKTGEQEKPRMNVQVRMLFLCSHCVGFGDSYNPTLYRAQN